MAERAAFRRARRWGKVHRLPGGAGSCWRRPWRSGRVPSALQRNPQRPAGGKATLAEPSRRLRCRKASKAHRRCCSNDIVMKFLVFWRKDVTLYFATQRNSAILWSSGQLGTGTPMNSSKVGHSVRHTKLRYLELRDTWSGRLASRERIDSRQNSTGKGWWVIKPSWSLSHRNWSTGTAWLMWQWSNEMYEAKAFRTCTELVWMARCSLRVLLPPAKPMSRQRVRKSVTTCAFRFKYFTSKQAKLMKTCEINKSHDCCFNLQLIIVVLCRFQSALPQKLWSNLESASSIITVI